MRDRHRLDEEFLEPGRDGGLYLLDSAHQFLDDAARALVEQRDARAGAGRVACRADVGQGAIGDEPQHHRVLDVDVAAESAGEADAVDVVDAVRLHQQPHAGIQLLMERLGVASVGRIRLAGAFGSHIDVKYAMVLGMIPDCDLSKVASAGNAAGTGARIALLDSRSRATIEEIVRRVEKVETAIEPRFQAHFVESMAIPHKTAEYPNLRKAVDLPEPKPATQTDGRERRNRRAATRG